MSSALHDIKICRAEFPGDVDAVLAIWREYIASPSVSLAYQDDETEFANLPGKYAAPKGCVLLAWVEDKLQGCIAFRQVDAVICEMKRLYVQPGARGLNLGRRLVEALIVSAKHAGYSEIRLDVLAELTAAQQLYNELGFVPAEPISFNPTPGTQFLGLSLS